MVGTVASNVIAAALDVFSFTLLPLFLNALFGEQQLIPRAAPAWITSAHQRMVGAFLDPADRLGSVETMMIAIIAIVTLKNLFVWLAGQFGASLQENVTRDLRDGVFRHIQRLPLGWFQRTKTGQIISRVLSDTEQTKALITELVTRTLQNLAQIIGTIVILLSYSVQLTFVALVIAPLLTLALQPVLRKLRKGHRRLRGDYGEITSVLQEAVSGVRLVKSFRGEPYEDARFTEASHRYSSGMVRINRIASLSQPMTELIGVSVAMMILWIGAREVLLGGSGAMDSATLITFMIMVMRLLPPLKQLSQAPTTAQQALASAERLFEVLDQPTEQQLDRGTRTVTGLRESIAFERVSFAYGEEPVLRDVSFVARRGEVVALVGASGAGKSTLVDLIPRFYEPTSGVIRLDGVDTREITLASLRGLTGIVSQDTVLFNDTVRNNIAYGSPDASQEQIVAAAVAANAMDFIERLPQGFDTPIGDRGVLLSGGQRQRIAIARALVRDPQILLFDEATSALDTESEMLVQEAINNLLVDRTAVVIAHRLSTIKHAHMIAVVENGAIVEYGRHEELLAAGNLYKRLYEVQFREDG
jgi:ATP-binding cassette, subfamily B, bacterial MsbA